MIFQEPKLLSNKTSHHILLVDDDLLLHTLLEEYFRAHGSYKIHALQDGEGLGLLIDKQQPDMIMLDIMLPGKDGWYWLDWLKRCHPHIPVLLLSAKNQPDDRLRGFESGAADYLIKPFHPGELLIRISHILHPQHITGHKRYQVGEYLFDPMQETLQAENSQIRLSTLESRLLLFFCENAGQTLTRDAISLALNGNEHHPLNRSIDMAITRLRKKLGDDKEKPQYLHTVWRKGYRLTLNA